jgi:CelD/BcsL family acetyltransferase involved in cellulose biosynthesis
VISGVWSDWDRVNRCARNHILLDAGFVERLVRFFGGDNLVLARHKSDSRPAFALLAKSGRVSWTTFQPSQAPIGLIGLPDDETEAEVLVRSLLNALPSHVGMLSILQQDPEYSPLKPERVGRAAERVDYIETAKLTLADSFEVYWKNRGKNLRHNLGRQRRRLEEGGSVLRLETVTSPEKMDQCIRDYARLESGGWKREHGTAVAADNSQGRFYRSILEYFAERSEATVYRFLIDEKVTASDLCLVRDGMMVVLKTAYDETMEGCSPALLMRQNIMQKLHDEKKVHTIEFYGRVLDWHTKWTTDIRSMFHINMFRYPLLMKIRSLARRLS